MRDTYEPELYVCVLIAQVAALGSATTARPAAAQGEQRKGLVQALSLALGRAAHGAPGLPTVPGAHALDACIQFVLFHVLQLLLYVVHTVPGAHDAPGAPAPGAHAQAQMSKRARQDQQEANRLAVEAMAKATNVSAKAYMLFLP
jgi:hypothetical protein